MNTETKPTVKPAATVSEYKGKPTLNIPLDADGKWLFSFGVGKARKILEYFDEIRDFIAQQPEVKNGN
jgi:hypothetical protein